MHWAEGIRTSCEDCPRYYTRADAKADARYKDRDRY